MNNGGAKRVIRYIDRRFLGGRLGRYRTLQAEHQIRHSLSASGNPAFLFFQGEAVVLRNLFDLYGSDKGSMMQKGSPFYPWEAHTYAEIYASLFGHCRGNVQRVFECGLGTNYSDIPSNMTETGRPGASHRAWREYFPEAEIYGADIDERVLFQDERIHTFAVDQTDEASVRRLWQRIGVTGFDLIIDDGLHTFDAGRVLFENSIDHLAPSGTYVIEDVTSSNLVRFRNYFANKDFFVAFVQMPRGPSGLVGDNAVVIVRKGN